MKRIAAPMVGGLLTSAFLTLEMIPVVYTYWRNEQLLWERLAPLDGGPPSPPAPPDRGPAGRVAGSSSPSAGAMVFYTEWPRHGLLVATLLVPLCWPSSEGWASTSGSAPPPSAGLGRSPVREGFRIVS